MKRVVMRVDLKLEASWHIGTLDSLLAKKKEENCEYLAAEKKIKESGVQKEEKSEADSRNFDEILRHPGTG